MRYFILDGAIFIFSFFSVFYYRKGIVYFSNEYKLLLFILLASVTLSGLMTKKYPKKKYDTFLLVFKQYFSGIFVILGFVSFGIMYLDLQTISRSILLLTIGISFALELSALLFIYREKLFKPEKLKKPLFFNIKYFIAESILLGVTFLYMYLYSPLWKTHWAQLSWLIYVSWLLSSMYTHQFYSNYNQNYFKYIYQSIRFGIFFISIIIFLLFLLRLDYELQILSINIMFAFVVLLITYKTILYIQYKPNISDEIAAHYFSVGMVQSDQLYDEECFISEKYSKINSNELLLKFSEKLKNIYLRTQEPIYHFLDHSISLDSFDILKSTVIRSSDPYNVDILPDEYIDFIMNLHELNDIRHINKYFRKVNQKLQDGGIYVGCFEPIRLRFYRFTEKYPENFAIFFYAFDFIWKRLFSKLPFFQKIYFALTNGKDRALSKSEGLGRLYYTGFEVLAITEYRNLLYFIAKKSGKPFKDENPSFGPFFKMKRMGKGGKPILIYKLRTMHPYSEYLQKFIYDRYHLDDGGKFNNDFRVTRWGAVFRKLWIDELPQLINLIKGDIKLVGVRALSSHYLSLYPEDFQDYRNTFKPGLVPPYYVDLPKSLDDIIKSEKRYLEQYQKQPIWTDIKYFFKVFYNIIFKQARSK